MPDRWIRILRVLLVFALSGWMAVVVMMARDDSWTVLRAVMSRYPLQGALAAAVAGLAWAPLLGWGRLRWWAGAAVGLPAGLTGLYLYFFTWPHDWQAGRVNAWKSVALFLDVYYWLLAPAGALAGAMGTIWAKQPIRLPRWAREAEEPSSPALPPTLQAPATKEPDPELERPTERIDPETLRALEQQYRKDSQ